MMWPLSVSNKITMFQREPLLGWSTSMIMIRGEHQKEGRLLSKKTKRTFKNRSPSSENKWMMQVLGKQTRFKSIMSLWEWARQGSQPDLPRTIFQLSMKMSWRAAYLLKTMREFLRWGSRQDQKWGLPFPWSEEPQASSKKVKGLILLGGLSNKNTWVELLWENSRTARTRVRNNRYRGSAKNSILLLRL